MGYGRYIGYVGALAVALGVGAAVATPGIAYALPADTGSQSPTPGDTSPTDTSPPSSATTVASPTTPTPSGTDSDGVAPNGMGGNGLGLLGPDVQSRVAGALTKIFGGGHGAPVVVLRSSGGARTAAKVDGNAKKPAIAADLPETGKADAGLSPVKTQSTLLHSYLDRTPTRSLAPPDAAASGAPTTGQPFRSVVQSIPALRLAADTSGPAMRSLAAPPTAVVPAPPPRLGDIVEEPHTYLVGAVAQAAGAVLNVFLAPFGQGSPGQSPLMWTVLAFARNEFQRPSIPNAASGQVTPSLNQSPNLLINPGAEAGDPSLSGYAAVTVPGWSQTGTPTVIEYGTQRRFPVPTASPGPVLPALLAFPTSDNASPTPGGDQQFFGGGPVADSTLTQTVDLTAAKGLIDAGGGTYTLSGDLGGFLIDPSSSTVTVNFLDKDGNTLGTGTLKPVTAWDRTFSTGFIHRSVTGAIPVNTRSAQVVVKFDDQNPVLGNYNNAYADNLSFTVNDPSLTPGTLAPPESNVGQLDHVFMVYMENKGVGQIVGSPNAPYLNELIANYGYASNYYGLTHPSDPNYYPIIGGSDFGINYNCPSNCFPAGTPNLADEIEAAKKTWAGYMEGGGGYSTPTDRLPFLAFSDIYNNPDRVAAHLFDISQMEKDLASPATTPNFVWFAADDATNMEGPTDFPVGSFNWLLGYLNPAHQYNVAAGDAWLQDQVTTIMASPTWNDPNVKSAIFITFDEDYNNISTGVGNEGNHIVMIVIPSPGAVYDAKTNPTGMRSGAFVASDYYNHYSLQRTIEESLGLPPLTNNDKYAQPMNEFWYIPDVV
jgi:hypothetical protein